MGESSGTRAGPGWLILASVLFASWASLRGSPLPHALPLPLAAVLFALHIKLPSNVLVPFLSWALLTLQVLVLAHIGPEPSVKERLSWALLLDYLVFVTLPYRLLYCLILSAATCFSYLVVFFISTFDPDVERQMMAIGLMLITSNMLGLISFYLEERQQATALQETKQCLEMKLLVEEQAAEQERLLLSVLPEHVAVMMRQDMGTSLDSQFKKIYMSRHENVSILYADIVGFTAISSTYSASELVKILNELFARFDRLSEKYHQLRIKILGDCYYCISGAPRERADHAILSVHMGLSMVKAIKYVQQTTNSPVDMRVGIHTGAVLAGVLGQRQWQFDVYSKDVELANKMESSGLPGRVHVSEKTLSFLNGEFEVEPGYGEKREESLRMAGIKTHFIVKALKPFQSNGKEVKNGGVADQKMNDHDEDFTGVITPVEESTGTMKGKEHSDDFDERFKKDLLKRDGYKDLSKHTNFLTLTFKDKTKEENYVNSSESFNSISLVGCPLVLFVTGIARVFILPRDITNTVSFILSFWFLSVMTFFVIGDMFNSTVFPELPRKISKVLNASVWGRRLIALVFIWILGTTSFIDLSGCVTAKTNCTSVGDAWQGPCPYPSYSSHLVLPVLIAASLPSQISYLSKAGLLLLIAAGHTIANFLLLSDPLYCELPPDDWTGVMGGRENLSILLIMVAIFLAFLARYMEKASRVLYVWKIEVEEQRERALEMRRRNEALVYNILPPHVAQHFLGNKKRQHEELYSQSYAEVGVLFASMPNFTDFYSEETVNNQGLECLRFLNEVISDFDALLGQPKYQDIIKIKTISSTYMAASGLNSPRQSKADDPVEVRWAHLSLLVEFAMDLKKALQSINEQSFNHFVLKMGINHGPITAGVIGARKPHYDIWGNTVNVASRMESTGKAGSIQVTEETSEILRHFGYTFEQRGLVAVKGKGQLMTYYLIGKEEGVKNVDAPATGTSAGQAEETEPPTDGASDQQALLSDADRPTIVARER